MPEKAFVRFVGLVACVAACLALLITGGSTLAWPQAQVPPSASQIADYEAYRFWINKQPVDVQRSAPEVIFQRYAAELRSQGKSEAEVTRVLASLLNTGTSAEVERWNRILTAPNPNFNTEPNAFLVQMTRGVKPGRALDVGMGQGRNTIYLAQQGWNAVGFDPAERAVAAARDQAAKLGVKITTHIATSEAFDWGEAQWDLVVMSYVSLREFIPQVIRSLRPGGMVVVEAFHRDATKTSPIGGGVVFDNNELLQLFSDLRVVRYEDTDAIGDFGGRNQTRVVRFAAVKP